MTLRYDSPGKKCLGKVQPGTDALRDWVLAHFDDFSDLGIYNCRSVRGGSAPSVHGEGRAWDAGCTDQMRGDALAAWLVKNADPLCIQAVIWWERDWRVGMGWTPYDGASAHRDHLHIEQNWDGARNLTYAEIDRLVKGGHVASVVSVDKVPGTDGVVVLFDDGAVHAHRTEYHGGPNVLKPEYVGLGRDPLWVGAFRNGHYAVVTRPGVLLDFTQANRKFTTLA